MSVYIDPEISCIPSGAYRWRRVTHLFADTLEELHTFAAKIGMRREWFQHKPGCLPHYDLNTSRRARAVELGAKELDGAELLEKWHEIKGDWHLPDAPP